MPNTHLRFGVENPTTGKAAFWVEPYRIEDGNDGTFCRDVPSNGLRSMTELVPVADHLHRRMNTRLQCNKTRTHRIETDLDVD